MPECASNWISVSNCCSPKKCMESVRQRVWWKKRWKKIAHTHIRLLHTLVCWLRYFFARDSLDCVEWLVGLFHMILNYACEPIANSPFRLPHHVSLIFYWQRFFALSSPSTARPWQQRRKAIHVYIRCKRCRLLSVSREMLESRIWFRYLFIWCSFDDVQKFILNSLFFPLSLFLSLSFSLIQCAVVSHLAKIEW